MGGGGRGGGGVVRHMGGWVGVRDVVEACLRGAGGWCSGQRADADGHRS